MLLKFTGTTKRVVGAHVWSRENNWLASVDDDLAAILITSPGDRFVIADDDPLLKIVGREYAPALLVEGIGSPDALAGLKASEARKVAKAIGAEYGVVRKWIDAARNEIGAAPGQETEDGSDSIDGG